VYKFRNDRLYHRHEWRCLTLIFDKNYLVELYYICIHYNLLIHTYHFFNSKNFIYVKFEIASLICFSIFDLNYQVYNLYDQPYYFPSSLNNSFINSGKSLLVCFYLNCISGKFLVTYLIFFNFSVSLLITILPCPFKFIA